ncbi:MAG: DUF6505 family protein [Hansschlegelia sp.]
MSALRLPRTIRFDPSDTFVFERPAEPGEWAVPGSFLFWDQDVAALAGKQRAAFRAGFVGVSSLGFSTLVVIVEATEAERAEAVEDLARHIHERFGAPDLDAARAAAGEEIEIAASLCRPEVGTLIAMHRTLEAGEIRESFRTLRRREPGEDRLHAGLRAFRLIESDDEEQPEERVDLLALHGSRRS